MVKKHHIVKALIIILVFISLVHIVLAGPVPLQDITFSFNIPEKTLDNGEWKIYVISIGEFEKDNWNFTTNYNKIKYSYIDFKEECGTDKAFYVTVYKMDDEERKHKGCVINGTYQEVYCFKTVTNKDKCSSLTPYKINDKNNLDFLSYYSSYMWDINRADFYNHFEPSYCNVENNSCKFIIHKSSYPYNPYIIVLERLNSTNEIYFSNRLNINDVNLFYNESIFPTDAIMFHINLNVELNLTKLELKNSNILKIEFNNQSKIMYNQNSTKTENSENQLHNLKPIKDNFFKRTITWIRHIFS